MPIATKTEAIQELENFVAAPAYGNLDIERIQRNLEACLFAIKENSLPNLTIVVWGGPINRIPVGWFICDGSNGTPDLSAEALTYIMKNNPTSLNADAAK